jgi:hypothetical protein
MGRLASGTLPNFDNLPERTHIAQLFEPSARSGQKISLDTKSRCLILKT